MEYLEALELQNAVRSLERKPDDNMDPMDITNELLKEMQIDDRTGMDSTDKCDPLEVRIREFFGLPLEGRYRNPIGTGVLERRRLNHQRTPKQILLFIPQHKRQ